MEWKRSCGKQNEPPPPTPKTSLHPNKVMLCIRYDWKGVLYYELLLKNQMINSNKYCSQLDQLKAALHEKHLGLVNRKYRIFHKDNTRSCCFDDQAKTARAWLGSCDSSIHHIHQTLHLWIFIYFKILLMEKISIPWKTVKGTWNSSFLKKIKSFGKMKL